MCGIVGVVDIYKGENRFLSKIQTDIFSQMLMVNVVRGRDGTGIIGVKHTTNEAKYVKIAGLPHELFASKAFQSMTEAIRSFELVALIGHNRAATVGACTVDNTHPFKHDHIRLVHNGTLQDTSDLFGKERFPVDSMAIAKGLAIHGWDKTFNKLKGSWACVWHDEKENKIFFARNEERPLWYCYTNTTFYFASESGLLMWILGRNGIKMSDTPNGMEATIPKEFETEKVYSLSFTKDAPYGLQEEGKWEPYYRNAKFLTKIGGNGGSVIPMKMTEESELPDHPDLLIGNSVGRGVDLEKFRQTKKIAKSSTPIPSYLTGGNYSSTYVATHQPSTSVTKTISSYADIKRLHGVCVGDTVLCRVADIDYDWDPARNKLKMELNVQPVKPEWESIEIKAIWWVDSNEPLEDLWTTNYIQAKVVSMKYNLGDITDIKVFLKKVVPVPDDTLIELAVGKRI